MKKIFNRVIIVFACLVVKSQVSISQDRNTKLFSPVVAPSPAVANLGKYGNLPIELSTGAAAVSIPLYKLGIRDSYEIDFGLNYSSNGVRVDGQAGNVGTDWSFIGEFAIKRTVLDDPDEYGSVHDMTRKLDNGFNADSMNSLIQMGKTEAGDSQPDLFTLVAPGFSGKFILLGDSGVFLNQNTSYKVKRRRGFGFTVVDGKGNVLEYGGYAVETTNNRSSCTDEDYYPNGSSHPTAWFLKHIITAKKDTIQFEYSPHIYGYTSSRTRVDVISQKVVSSAGSSCGCGARGTQICNTQTSVSTYKLEYIRASNAKITFEYGDPLDIGSGKLIKGIYVYTASSLKDTLLKRVLLKYNYGVGKKRPFLSNVTIFAGNGQDSMAYSMLYNKIDLLPDRLDDMVDAWGYYNGNPYDIAVSPSVSYYGTLAKITYPTGGYDTLYYETNSIHANHKKEVLHHIGMLRGSGAGDHSPNVYSITETIYKKDGDIRIGGSCQWNFTGAPDIPMHKMVFDIKNANTNQTYYTKIVYANEILTYTNVSTANMFPSGDSTKLNFVLTVYGEYAYGEVVMNQYIKVDDPYDEPFGGVRTAKVKSVNNLGESATKRYYYYSSFDRPNVSSGRQVVAPEFVEELYMTNYCASGVATCYYKLQHKKSKVDLFSYSNAPLYYYTVIEGFGDNMENGAVLHEFHLMFPYSGGMLYAANVGYIGSNFIEAPYSIDREQVAAEKYRIYFKRSGDSLRAVKRINYEYIWQPDVAKKRSGYAFQQKIFREPDPTPNLYYSYFDTYKYTYTPSWFGKSMETEITYTDDNKAITTVNRMFYDNAPANSNVTRTELYTSKGELLKYYFKYADSFRGQQVYDSMISRNMLDPVLEVKKFVNSGMTEQEVSSYGFANANRDIIALSNVQVKRANYPLENRYVFYRYDSFGNVLERSKANDVHEVYLWGYNNQYPVVKVVGSTYDVVLSFVNQQVLQNPASDQQLRDELKKIRLGLANSSAQVSTYTYLPLVGVTSETGPDGKTTYYEYDGMGRLKLIRDKDGKIIKQFDYQYQKTVTQ